MRRYALPEMTRALLIDFADLLKKQGDNIAGDLRDGLPEASGDLKKSVDSNVEMNGSVITLTVSAADYVRYVELGRRPGQKRPPLVAIEKWCKLKGIPVRAAFPIAKAIGEKGITGKHLVPGIIARRQPGIEAIVKRAFGESVKVEAENLLKRFVEKKAA